MSCCHVEWLFYMSSWQDGVFLISQYSFIVWLSLLLCTSDISKQWFFSKMGTMPFYRVSDIQFGKCRGLGILCLFQIPQHIGFVNLGLRWQNPTLPVSSVVSCHNKRCTGAFQLFQTDTHYSPLPRHFWLGSSRMMLLGGKASYLHQS